jgi:translation elongation factor EF-1alpha
MGKEKTHMSMTIIGHVGTGKTTVIEQLLNLSSGMHRQTIDQGEKEATHVKLFLVILVL